jgi:hypothetical protein
MLPLLLVALSPFATPVCVTLPQEPPAAARPAFGENLLAGLPAAERSVEGTPIPLPRLQAETPEYRLRLTATLMSGSGPLQVLVPRSKGAPHRFVSKEPGVGGCVQFEVTIRGDAATADRDVWSVPVGDRESLPAITTAASLAKTGVYRLDSLQWAPLVAKPTTAPKAPKAVPEKADRAVAAAAKVVANPAARLGAKQRWNGRLNGDRRDGDCSLVVLDHSSQSLTFRLENEAGGWFRFECSVKDGKVTVDRIVHTRDANGGAKALIDQEKGVGRIDGKAFVLDFSYRNDHRGQKGTVKGKVTIPLD